MSPPTQPIPNGITALISGAGIGGLTAALELWRNGCTVRILERTPASLQIGDTILIGPSALRFLKHWPEMQARHDQIAYDPLIVKCTHKGERLHEPQKMDLLMKSSRKSYQHARPKLHAMLLEQVEKCGLEIEYGKEVVDYFEDVEKAKGGLVLKGGERVEADVVVAADGVRGKSWGLVAGEPVPARSSGSAIFRAAYPVELALRNPAVAERFQLTENGEAVFELWVGAGMFGTFWRNDTHMMWSITRTDLGTAEESWGNKVTADTVLKYTATIPGWPDVANSVIEATPADTIVDWKLMWRDSQPKWTSPGGYVLQLGDSAHTYLPSSGNGGTQAVEDGVSIAACIARAGRGKVSDATRVHNLLRFERVSFLQALGIARRDERVNHGATKQKPPPIPGSWLS